MKITSIKVSSVTAQPEARSHFMSGARRWYWCHSALKHSQWKSMGVTCSVMSDRSLFTLLVISHDPLNSYIHDTSHRWQTFSSFWIRTFSSATRRAATHKHTFIAKFDSWLKRLSGEIWLYSVDMGWPTQEERHIPYTQTDIHTISIYRQRVKQREEGGTYSGKVTG